jgi:hypothetical protein
MSLDNPRITLNSFSHGDAVMIDRELENHDLISHEFLEGH